MSKDGLVAASDTETTTAPKTMYEEIEQEENVARGYVGVTEILAYEATEEPRRYSPENIGEQGEIRKDKSGNVLYVEKSRKPYFCQTKEQEVIFAENNPTLRLETHSIQLLKSTAIKYLNSARNMKQFGKVKV